MPNDFKNDPLKYIKKKSESEAALFEEQFRRITKEFERNQTKINKQHERAIDAIEKKYNGNQGGLERGGRFLGRSLLAGTFSGQLLLTFNDLLETIYPKSARAERKKERELIKQKAELDKAELERGKKMEKWEQLRSQQSLVAIKQMEIELQLKKEYNEAMKKEVNIQKVGGERREGDKLELAIRPKSDVLIQEQQDQVNVMKQIHKDIQFQTKQEVIIEKKRTVTEKARDKMLGIGKKIKEGVKGTKGAIKQAAMDFLPLLLILLPPLIGALIKSIKEGMTDLIYNIRGIFGGGAEKVAAEDVKNAVTDESRKQAMDALNRFRLQKGKKIIDEKEYGREYKTTLGKTLESQSKDIKNKYEGTINPSTGNIYTEEEIENKAAADVLSGRNKAKGGPVKVGRSYTVGEKGTEAFTPISDGMIIPNNSPLFGGAGTLLAKDKAREKEKLNSQQQMNDKLVNAITGQNKTIVDIDNAGVGNQRIIHRDYSPISELLRYRLLTGN